MGQKTNKSIRYNLSFKEMVCKEYCSGQYSKGELERKYELGHGRVLGWLYELGYETRKSLNLVKVKDQKPINSENDSREHDSLKQELENVKLELESYKMMLEIAERELKINIRKKFNTK